MVNIAHSESKDVMTKAQSFLSTEESENHLGLSTLTRKGAVHSQQLLPPQCEQGLSQGDRKCWILAVCPGMLDSRQEDEEGDPAGLALTAWLGHFTWCTFLPWR